MIWLLSALARLLGPILPFLATWLVAKRDARQKARIDRLRDDAEALKARERIEDEIDQDNDLAARARRAGVLRKPGK